MLTGCVFGKHGIAAENQTGRSFSLRITIHKFLRK